MGGPIQEVSLEEGHEEGCWDRESSRVPEATRELRGRLARGVSWGREGGHSQQREGWLPLLSLGAQAEPGCKGG